MYICIYVYIYVNMYIYSSMDEIHPVTAHTYRLTPVLTMNPD